MSSVCAVVGGQFGSEGKGLIVGHIAQEYDHHVRVGAANAGHTLYTSGDALGEFDFQREPEKHVMQQIPCAAYANPEAELYIGPGALISANIFGEELQRAHRWRTRRGLPPLRLRVDPRAHVIQIGQIEREAESGLAERIGSTSTIAREGIGVAQADRVMREVGCLTVADLYGLGDCRAYGGFHIVDVPERLALAVDVLLEGTQGAGLSTTTGDFPYVTSRNTTSAGLCADAGVAPTLLDRVILVCRTYPIRVAGPSGPFYRGSIEMEWSDLGIDPEKERTTVTKKVRRVASFSVEQVAEAAYLNGATEIALTFCDYLQPEIAGASGPMGPGELVDHIDLLDRINHIEDQTGVPVTMLGTGPHSVIDFKR